MVSRVWTGRSPVRERGSRKPSSISTATPVAVPPHASISCRVATTVPPVASTSSIISTRSPSEIASRCTSRVASPYSRAYDTAWVSRGSLPALRIGTKPTPSASATGAARMKPRASMPTTLSTTTVPLVSRPAAASAVMIAENAWWSARTGVMSLNVTPSCGQSATSTVRRVSASWAVRRSGIGGRSVDHAVVGLVDARDRRAGDLDLGAGGDLEAGGLVGDGPDGAVDARRHHHPLADLDAALQGGHLTLPALLRTHHHEPEQGQDGDEREKCGKVVHVGAPRGGRVRE